MTPREAQGGTLAAAIVALRKRLGSQVKLAEAVGVTDRTVKRWEKGAVPEEPARSELIRLGVPEALFHAYVREEVERRLRAVEAETARIRELLG